MDVFFQNSHKNVILRACDFFDLFVFFVHLVRCFSTPPQDRHPERSASQIYRIMEGSMARSQRTPAMLVDKCSSELSGHRSPHPADPPPVFPSGREQELHRAIHREYKNFAQTWGLLCMKRCARDHPVPSAARFCSGLRWLKSSEQHGQDKHRRGPSTPRHKILHYAIDL